MRMRYLLLNTLFILADLSGPAWSTVCHWLSGEDWVWQGLPNADDPSPLPGPKFNPTGAAWSDWSVAQTWEQMESPPLCALSNSSCRRQRSIRVGLECLGGRSVGTMGADGLERPPLGAWIEGGVPIATFAFTGCWSVNIYSKSMHIHVCECVGLHRSFMCTYHSSPMVWSCSPGLEAWATWRFGIWELETW